MSRMIWWSYIIYIQFNRFTTISKSIIELYLNLESNDFVRDVLEGHGPSGACDSLEVPGLSLRRLSPLDSTAESGCTSHKKEEEEEFKMRHSSSTLFLDNRNW